MHKTVDENQYRIRSNTGAIPRLINDKIRTTPVKTRKHVFFMRKNSEVYLTVLWSSVFSPRPHSAGAAEISGCWAALACLQGRLEQMKKERQTPHLRAKTQRIFNLVPARHADGAPL